MKYLADYYGISSRRKSKIIPDERHRTVLLRGSSTSNDELGTLYVKDVIMVLQKLVEFCGKAGNMIRPEKGKPITESFYKERIQTTSSTL